MLTKKISKVTETITRKTAYEIGEKLDEIAKYRKLLSWQIVQDKFGDWNLFVVYEI